MKKDSEEFQSVWQAFDKVRQAHPSPPIAPVAASRVAQPLSPRERFDAWLANGTVAIVVYVLVMGAYLKPDGDSIISVLVLAPLLLVVTLPFLGRQPDRRPLVFSAYFYGLYVLMLLAVPFFGWWLSPVSPADILQLAGGLQSTLQKGLSPISLALALLLPWPLLVACRSQAEAWPWLDLSRPRRWWWMMLACIFWISLCGGLGLFGWQLREARRAAVLPTSQSALAALDDLRIGLNIESEGSNYKDPRLRKLLKLDDRKLRDMRSGNLSGPAHWLVQDWPDKVTALYHRDLVLQSRILMMANSRIRERLAEGKSVAYESSYARLAFRAMLDETRYGLARENLVFSHHDDLVLGYLCSGNLSAAEVDEWPRLLREYSTLWETQKQLDSRTLFRWAATSPEISWPGEPAPEATLTEAQKEPLILFGHNFQRSLPEMALEAEKLIYLWSNQYGHRDYWPNSQTAARQAKFYSASQRLNQYDSDLPVVAAAILWLRDHHAREGSYPKTVPFKLGATEYLLRDGKAVLSQGEPGTSYHREWVLP